MVDRPQRRAKIVAEPETAAELTVCAVVELETVLAFMAKSLQSLRLFRGVHGTVVVDQREAVLELVVNSLQTLRLSRS